MEQKFYDLVRAQAIWPENFNEKTTNSTGEYLIECSNCVKSSYGRNAHDNYYCYGIWNARGNAFSCSVPGENNYQAGPLGGVANSKFSAFLIRCDDCEYCYNCYDCTHCFGCVGLRHKQHCIFNRQYKENEYWSKVDELKCMMMERGEYGRPFPAAFTHSYYPEGGPVMYMGAGLEHWNVIDFPRFDIEAEGAFGSVRLKGKAVRKREEVPEHIQDLDPTVWAGMPINDPDIRRPFTFLKPEIEFYQRHHIAPPRQHFTTRMRDLMWRMNTGLFVESNCAECGQSMTVATNRTFTNRRIFCRACYLKFLGAHSSYVQNSQL